MNHCSLGVYRGTSGDITETSNTTVLSVDWDSRAYRCSIATQAGLCTSHMFANILTVDQNLLGSVILIDTS